MNKTMAGVAVIVRLLCATEVYPCSIPAPVSNVAMIREADAIVRATAESYAIAPKSRDSWSGFLPDSHVRFKVLEVVRGKLPADHLVLPGTLVNTDDFNDRASPYNLVRPDGRRGDPRYAAFLKKLNLLN